MLKLFPFIFLLLTLPNLITQNLIGDEAVYIAEGDRYLHQPYSYYYNSGSPHFLKSLSAVFYYFLPFNRNYSPYFKDFHTDVYSVANFTYEQNLAYSQNIIQRARIPHVLLAILLGITLYIFTKKYFNQKIATLGLILYTFNPLILAHAATANLDIGTTAFCFFTIGLYYVFLTAHSNKRKLLILTGILLGISQATKISAILLYPFILAAPAVLKTQKIYKQVFLIIGISFITLWCLYGFQIGPILTSSDDPAGIESLYGSIPTVKNFKTDITTMLRLPIFPAGAYFNNFAYQFTHSFYGHTVYFNGRFTDEGVWYLIPVLFLYKNSLIFLAIILISLFTFIIKRTMFQPLTKFLFLWLGIITFWSLTNKLQLGLRYFLPAYPALFILSAKGITETLHNFINHKLHSKIIASIMTLYVLSTLSVYPNFFTHTNELLKTQDISYYLSDSDYDWGQSVFQVGQTQREKNMYPLFFKQSGGADQRYYKIQNDGDPQHKFREKKDGYYAFSHSAYVGLKKEDPELFAYFSKQKPTTIIANVIYVYKITF